MDYLKKQLPKMDSDNPKELKRQKYRRMIERAQEASDSFGRDARKNSVEMDESIQVQCELVYGLRNRLISEPDLQGVNLLEILQTVIDEFLDSHDLINEETLRRFIYDTLSYHFEAFDTIDLSDKESIRAALKGIFIKEMDEKMIVFPEKSDFVHFQRMSILKAIDEAWIEQVDYLQQFRVIVSSRHSAQRNTTYEFHKEALQSYQNLQHGIKKSIIRNLALSMLIYNAKGELVAYFA